MRRGKAECNSEALRDSGPHPQIETKHEDHQTEQIKLMLHGCRGALHGKEEGAEQGQDLHHQTDVLLNALERMI